MDSKPIKVLIVDDSPVSQNLLQFVIESDPKLKVIGIAKSGEETLEVLKRELPDVITMDIVMPKMDGFETTRRILRQWSIPIVVVSDYYNRKDVDKCFQAMEAGALAILEKPKGVGHVDYETMSLSLVETIKTMATIKPSRIKNGIAKRDAESIMGSQEGKAVHKIDAVVIGASIGGPPALLAILSELPASFNAPIFIVQNMSGRFMQSLAEWLARATPLTISIPHDGQQIQPGHIYVAPDNHHMEIRSDGKISVLSAPTDQGPKPSIGRLFKSAANYYGKHLAGMLLSGMGNDGVDEMIYIKEKGGFTIAQNEETCVMFSKPGEAVKKGGVNAVLPISEIPIILEHLIGLGIDGKNVTQKTI